MEANPYQPPDVETAAKSELVPARRAPQVMGAISLCLACLGLVYATRIGHLYYRIRPLLGPSYEMATEDSEIGRQARANIARYRYQAATAASVGLLSLALVAIGVGQLRRRRWARVASLWWGSVAIVAVGAGMVHSVLVVVPALVESPEVTGDRWQMATWTVFHHAWLFLPFPVAQVICFTRRSVRLAMVR